MLLVVSLGLTAAVLFACAASLQQHEAHQANRTIAHQLQRHEVRDRVEAGVHRPALLIALGKQLPRSRLWWIGWGANLAGFLVQGAALYVGSVALVQPLLVTQLLFALPLTTWWTRQWPSRRAWLSGAAICGGVALFVVAHGASSLGGRADRPRIIIAGASAAAIIGLLVYASTKQRPLVQAALLSVGAGLCFAMSAALMKLTAADLVERGVAATAAGWPGYALAVSATTGVVLGQWAFATGSLPTAVATMTITNPVASYLIGVLAFEVSPQATPLRLAAVATAGAVISVGVVGLSRSSIVQPMAYERPGAVNSRKKPGPRKRQ